MDGGRIRQLLTDAKAHADVGDMLLASQLYTKATEIEPNNAAAWYGLGVVQTARGFPDDSRLAFEKANMLDPEHAPTAANLAVLLENIDPVSEAQLILSLYLITFVLMHLDQNQIEQMPPFLYIEQVQV